MVKHLSRVGIVLMVAVLAASCSKSSNPSTSNNTPPTLSHPNFSGPNTTSDSAGALEAQSVALEIGVYTALASSFMVGQGTQNGSSWTWTVPVGANFTEKWTGTIQSNGDYQWTLIFNGATDTLTYNNWTYLKGTTSKDGKTGSWTVYYTNTTKPQVQFSWSTSSDSTVTAVALVLDTSGNTLETTTLINHPDKSGEVDANEGGILIFKATWLSNGSGQWWEYDPSSGVQVYYSTWT